MKLLKKGQVGGLQGFVLSIVTVAIVLAIGLIVVTELKDATKVMGTTSISNETIAITQSGGLGTGAVSVGGELFIGASAARNASDTELALTLGTIGPQNVSVSSTGGVTINATAVNTSNIRLDYSHYTPSAAYNSTGTIITKLATVPTWIGIIIIVSLAFIVLSFFIGKRQ
jgi:ABC-type transport system involved in multi-copper enzyme maturation permease subunit